MATSVADANRALEAALKENAKLKKRLAKLQRIESGLDSKDGSGADRVQRETARDVCRQAFDDFDLDKSGFIELNELALLATELNAPMSQAELEAANKAIDVSGDGKISFDEFYKWWTGAAAASAKGDDNPVALALLHARLLSHKGQKILEQMANEAKKTGAAPAKAAAATATTTTAAAADVKSAPATDAKAGTFDAPVPAGARVHDFALSVGDFESGPATAKVVVGLKNGLVSDPALQASDARFGTFVSVDLKTTGQPDFVPYLQAVAASFSKSAAKYVTLSVTAPAKDVARVSIGLAVPVPDPTKLIASLGIDAAALERLLTVRLEFGHSLMDLFDEKQGLTITDLATFRVESRIVADPAIVEALAKGVALIPSRRGRSAVPDGMGPFLGAWDSKVAFRFGSVKPLVEGLLDSPLAKGNAKFAKALKVLARTDSYMKQLEEQLREVQLKTAGSSKNPVGATLGGVRILALTLARDVRELLGVSVATRTGLGVQVTMDGVLDFGRIRDVANFADRVAFPQPKRD